MSADVDGETLPGRTGDVTAAAAAAATAWQAYGAMVGPLSAPTAAVGVRTQLQLLRRIDAAHAIHLPRPVERGRLTAPMMLPGWSLTTPGELKRCPCPSVWYNGTTSCCC